MRILVSIRIHHAQLKYILIFTPFITFSIDLGNYHLRMGVSIDEYRQRIGCFVSTMVIINTGYNNHAAHLYILVQ